MYSYDCVNMYMCELLATVVLILNCFLANLIERIAPERVTISLEQSVHSLDSLDLRCECNGNRTIKKNKKHTHTKAS